MVVVVTDLILNPLDYFWLTNIHILHTDMLAVNIIQMANNFLQAARRNLNCFCRIKNGSQIRF
ncbi:hypothetical protein D3C72_471240 [compost metagenome]